MNEGVILRNQLQTRGIFLGDFGRLRDNEASDPEEGLL